MRFKPYLKIQKPVKFILFLLPITMLVLLAGCVTEELDFDSIKSQNWNSEWAIPLINTDLTLEDFLNDSVDLIETGDDGLITLVYESEELVSLQASEIAEIPDQEKDIVKSFDLPQLPPGISGSLPLEFRFEFELDEEGLRIDSLLLNSGLYHFFVTTNIDDDVTSVDFVVPNFISSATGEPMQFSMSIEQQPGGGEIVKDTLLDLSLYKLVFEDSFVDTNFVYINALVNFTTDGEPYNNPYFIELNNQFLDMDFLKFFGYAGLRTIEMSDSINLNIFSLTEEGSFTFGDGSVNLQIDVENSFGLPTQLEVDRFMAYHNTGINDSVEIFIFGEGTPPVINLNYPTPGQVGQSVTTTINANNSNMNEALSISPDLLFIKLVGILNPEDDSTQSNFILDTSRIEAKVDVSLELFGQVNSFKVSDTVDFTLNSLDEVQSVLFATRITNGFPINAEIQLTFVDSLYNVIHRLYPVGEALMWAGEVGPGPEFRVVSPGVKDTETIVEGDVVGELGEARKIIITAVLNTTGNQEVKIYEDYGINLKLGVKLGLQL